MHAGGLKKQTEQVSGSCYMTIPRFVVVGSEGSNGCDERISDETLEW